MMIEAPAAGRAAILSTTILAPPAVPPIEDVEAAEEGTSRWATIAADLRFFLLCYVAGLIVFLVMLS